MVLFHLKSIDRVSGTSDSFVLNLSNYGFTYEDARNIKKVCLKGAIIPNTFYNIVTGINDRFCWFSGGSSRNYQIPAGAYAIQDLITLIQNAMNEAGDGSSYTITYSSITMKVTISATGSFKTNFASNAFSSTSCYKEIGWTLVDGVSADSAISPNVISLSRPYVLYVNIRELGNSDWRTSNILDRPTFVVPMQGESGEMVYWYALETLEQSLQFQGVNVTTLNISLSAPNGQTVSLNGSEWELIVEMK